MAAIDEMIGIALEIRPDQCTLVPERSGELTTEDGLDVIAEKERLSEAVRQLKDGGMRVSIFSRLDADQIRAAQAVGADRIELFTGAYGNAKASAEVDREFIRLLDAASLADELGLGLNAGHDLDVRNLPRVTTIPNLLEVSIGHSLMARALFIGLRGAVQELLAILKD
jgi:pyridoxine 5-phosphate synthase